MSEKPAVVVDVSLARSMVEPLYRDLTLPTGENVMQHADGIAGILREVRDDPELISAAYLFCVPSVIQNSGEWIEKSFRFRRQRLVQELGQVNELSRRARSENEEANTRHQVEAMRRMFLSMCNGLARRASQAREPFADASLVRRFKARGRGEVRRGNARSLRAAGQPPRHLAAEVGARGPGRCALRVRLNTGRSRSS